METILCRRLLALPLVVVVYLLVPGCASDICPTSEPATAQDNGADPAASEPCDEDGAASSASEPNGATTAPIAPGFQTQADDGLTTGEDHPPRCGCTTCSQVTPP